jgi:enolase
VSHRSGETEDTTIADVVAMGTTRIESGAPSRSAGRQVQPAAAIGKLGDSARYPGRAALSGVSSPARFAPETRVETPS